MSFIYLLLDWFNQNKRDFPWRKNKSVYRVWLSEIILQQTRVNQGMAYYHKFVDSFSTVKDLANADEQEVLNLWQGLGYYSRARNLHKTAKIVAYEMNGEFPSNFSQLKKLPGIGPYTAAAMASICYNEKVPAIDGNAYRVYSRFFGLDKDISDSNAHRFFFDYALGKMSTENAGDFNEAIMELGATVCMPSSPTCMFCPVQKDCVAFQTGTVDKYPVKTKKIKVKKRYFHYYFIQNTTTNQFLIKKRTQKGIWLNLFDFPLVETSNQELAKNEFSAFKSEKVSGLKHILTHQHLFINFYKVELNPSDFMFLEEKHQLISIAPNQIEDYPFPKPIFQFLDGYASELV